jgi:hypothetical protein
MTPDRKLRFARLVLSAALAAAAPLALAAADYGPPAQADKLSTAREHIAAKQWASAIDELKRVDDSASADWNNLMGYSMRKQATPDLQAAERYYDAALRIDPKHRGALEYSGELYLQKNDLVRAEQRLATLDKACFLPCREYTDLKKAIEQYKASGKHVAEKR